MSIQVSEPTIVGLNLLEFYRGLISILRRILVEVAIEEDLPDALRQPKTLVGIAEWKEYKDIDYLKDYIFSLFSLGTVKIINERIQWMGAGIRMLPEERRILTEDHPFASFFEYLGEAISSSLNGNKTSIDELVIWDALESHKVYKDLITFALSSYDNLTPEKILIVGDKAGWIGKLLWDRFKPKKIIYWVQNEREKELIEENKDILLIDCEIKIKQNDFTSYLKDIEPQDFIFVSNVLHWLTPDEIKIFIDGLSSVLSRNGKMLFLQPTLFETFNNPLFETLSKCHNKFRGYPRRGFIKEVLESKNLVITSIKYNLFIYAEFRDIGKETPKIPTNPPKFCRTCGNELIPFQLFCPKCGTLAKDRVVIPLL